jgi:WXG100 family type VII secretion target
VATTQAQAAVMEQVAGRFDDVRLSLHTILSNLMREVESVKNDWQGRGGASFEHVSRAWADDQRRLLGALGETATAIRTAGKVYTATDEAAADRMRPGPMSLPL